MDLADEFGSYRSSKPQNLQPRFIDERIRGLSLALETAYERLEVAQIGRHDTAAIHQEILSLKRQIRDGGQLKAGDFLLNGRFRLIEPLGHGGFATIWKGYDRQCRKPVAIKVLHGQYAHDRTRLERFFRGARQMAMLQHQGIVQVLEQQLEDGGYHFFVMEYLEGGDFRRAVLEKKLGTLERLAIIAAVGEALQFAHSKGVVHRDVKPANIVLNDRWQPKLTDFDLVRAMDTTGGTRTGMLGTVIYAAPEAMEKAQDAAESADVYGLGMTAVFALYGAELPFSIVRHPEGFIEKLDASESIKKVLRKAVAWEWKERYGSIIEFCDALNKPPSITPDSGIKLNNPEIERLLARLENFATRHEERAEIGDRLAQVGDPRPGVGLRADGLPDLVWCEVPGGKVTLERDAGTFVVEPFHIGKYPVTWIQYRSFLKADNGYRRNRWWQGLAVRQGESGPQYRPTDNHPAERVSWYDAVAFCRWLSARLGYEVRLPTEWEWQQAATGGDSTNNYPWGPKWDGSRANTYESELSRSTAVGLYPHGISPVGALDLSGNVWEWCLNEHDQPRNVTPAGDARRVVRGGAWDDDRTVARAAFRFFLAPDNRNNGLGFRLARASPI
ncbi:MAG: bifunctional serine/threonine-protein kinase/formylglycine-generating enzyme family protein [Candidatus Contendobacter sp.]|nr:bifunctional serine/threonine-protein kinase/formylglycine-generating enzyme family protein [Candidatus Contendobacter sp.]